MILNSDLVSIIVYFMIFALLHSFLAANFVKNAIYEKINWSNRIYKIFYNLIAVVSLSPVFLIIAASESPVVVHVGGAYALVIYLIKTVAFVLLMISIKPVLGDLSGMSELLGKNKDGSLITDGMFGVTRHPIYLFTLIFLWASPLITVNMLVTYSLVTLYAYIGSIFEEIKLVRQFSEYEAYRRETSRIIPFKWLLKRAGS